MECSAVNSSRIRTRTGLIKTAAQDSCPKILPLFQAAAIVSGEDRRPGFVFGVMALHLFHDIDAKQVKPLLEHPCGQSAQSKTGAAGSLVYTVF